MKMVRQSKTIIAMLVMMVCISIATPARSTHAGSVTISSIVSINSSCGIGAYVNFGGSGTATITFYSHWGSITSRQTRNLGYGMSTNAYSYQPADYGIVEVVTSNGNGTIYRVGCR